eukprot:TRINITY_DN65490_c0_g1_i1.p1 TRINITY_DN65490_c0_g1~~TRINITY_DN65490_c0_g1_i1.p1  ORF type:complete len:968 (-),score=136.69 TRINITY_DN65490_c0_g1_i1:57-2891(-)
MSDVVGYLASFPSMCYVSWWLANGWNGEDLAWLSGAFAGLLAVCTLLWAVSLSKAVVHGFAFLIGLTMLLAPAPILRAVVQEEVSTFTFHGRSDLALAICLLSLLIEGIRGSAIWAVKVRVINSRWKLLSHGSIWMVCQSVSAMVSPFLCEWIARRSSSSFITGNQKELADASIACVVPLCLVQFLVQMSTSAFIRQELGVASSSSLYRDVYTSNACCQRRSGSCAAEDISLKRSLFLRRLPPRLALAFGLGLGAAVLCAAKVLLERQQPYEPARRCMLKGVPRCTPVFDRTDAREVSAWAVWGHFGKNRFNQSTTGKFNCLATMKAVGGDTFVFWSHGRCQVWQCGKDAFVNPVVAHQSNDGEVWSLHCNMSGQDNIVVHLFEWSWSDIADECESYLGPAGFTAVQVAPPSEHVLGESWAVRYQPVSFKLESRSGSSEEFAAMVSRCRNAGVAIMVDAVLNHMASPFVQSPASESGKRCGASRDTSKTSTAPCEGWAGTGFGDREFLNGTVGLDRFERKDFHHYPGNEMSNCGIPPWTNNRHLCDLMGLVDLNTESVRVQQQLQNYLKALFEIGVTMLRLDAAMHVYPESFAQILEPFPWDYVVQEFYQSPLKFEKETLWKASFVGSFTNFDFGLQVAEVIFASWNLTGWQNRTTHFKDLLKIGKPASSDCKYSLCESIYPEDRSLMFVDNHDQQRARWKPEKGGPPDSPVCRWDGKEIGDCRPIYKNGLEYHLAQSFMLAWPYGDAVRLMSSYAFSRSDSGPPGVRRDSLHDLPASPVKCRLTPTSSPVTEEYDEDTARPWVCEHRWKGLAGLVRLRTLTGPSMHVSRQSSEDGRVAFCVGQVAFVALAQGFNWVTGYGAKQPWQLAGLNTSLPAGTYCDLAQAANPVPHPVRWNGTCFGKPGTEIVIGSYGIIAQGVVSPSGVVAVHVDFRKSASPTELVI